MAWTLHTCALRESRDSVDRKPRACYNRGELGTTDNRQREVFRMSTTIILPDNLIQRLQQEADSRQLSLDKLVATILDNTLAGRQNDQPGLQEIIAEIKALEPSQDSFHPATQSLADLLADAPDDPSFDLEEWNREWARAEAEIRAITRANTLAEARA